MVGQIQKLYIGKVRQHGNAGAKELMEQTWTTAMYKQETDTPVWLGKEGLEGDAVADTRHHGGAEKALFAYAVTHYPVFSEHYQQEIHVGSNGENIAVTGMDEDTVCIGDIYKIGDAIVKVAQPRRPCWKTSRRQGIVDFSVMLEETGKAGWHYRVLKEGYIQQGDMLELQERPYPNWTIQRMNDTLRGATDIASLKELQEAPFTPESWHGTLAKRIAGEPVDDTARLYGPNI
ncbi:MOSC domain-containing protein [Staphylococcus americanisciuri]|uniref:MOSC domain-containing protein n=1 Tax=Staphylococcus americanisciuri TaxID=2973940 RepID=A0ABT2EZS2_9STAP|nr:MOSC domain-containing protein [Staphylococcus americanisciuri]MCS4485709.1 MOSC domain-containing protein [Staphylococcus americanisciuri]